MKKIRVLCAATCIVLTGACLLTLFFINRLPEVEFVHIENEDVKHTVSVSGTVKVLEYGVFPSLSSDVESLYVKEGDKVSKNDVLCWIKRDEATAPVMAGMENYRNDIYNQYASALSLLVNNSDISDIYGSIKLNMLPDYSSVVQDTLRLQSPTDGIVTKVNVKEGENTGVALPAFIISDYSDVTVNCKIPEDKIDEIKVGQKVTVTGMGLKKSYNGRVASIANYANAVIMSGDKSTVDVEISVLNPDENIVSGFSANCSVLTDIERNVPVLPASAIYQDDNGKEYVYVLNNGRAEKKYTECTYISAKKAKVNDLEKDDSVIICTDTLKEGCRVKKKND